MGIASLVIGILSLIGVCVSLFPLLNVLNCIGVPVGLLGAILGVAALFSERENKWVAVAGLIFNGLALIIGVVRFAISFFTTGGIV
jgi:energy-coupling factor transporter transmembrane protein EcfT